MLHRWTLFACFCGIMAAGCKKPPQPSAPAPTLSADWITPITKATKAKLLSQPGSKETRKLLVAVLELPVGDEAALGLASFLNSTVDSLPVESLLSKSAAYQLAQKQTNILLTTNSLQLSIGTASHDNFTNVLQTPNAEVISFNQLVVQFGSEAVLSRGHSLPVLTGIGPPDKTGQPSLNWASVSFAKAVHVWLGSPTDGNFSIRVNVALEHFLGYLPLKGKLENQTPVFRINAFAAETEFPTNRVLVLATKPHKSIESFSKKIPYLSNLPIVGDHFERSGTKTNYIRTFIFIEATQ